jgi:hypothetical protein
VEFVPCVDRLCARKLVCAPEVEDERLASPWRVGARFAWTCALLFVALFALAGSAQAADLKTMKQGLGAGTVTSSTPGINCGADCNESYGSPVSVTLTATPAAGSTFVGWQGDCSGSGTCAVTMNAARSVRAEFALSAAIPAIADFTALGLAAYLTANPIVNTAGRFLKALPTEFKQNWLLMSRSESLQTGTARTPRVLAPSADTREVFSFGVEAHASYPGAHPNAIEYMQWDATQKNFRFHEIVLAPIPAMGTVPPRSRGVAIDEPRCTRCHSTRNVPNPSSDAGTSGIPPGSVKTKNKPNWDTYDSWAGALPFNRDRIYQGSVEAAAFRKIFNLWTFRDNDGVREVMEQLQLQPPGVPASHNITRFSGGASDGAVAFAFDPVTPVTSEPAPVGGSTASINYAFNNLPGGAGTTVQQGGSFVTLHHSDTPTSDEGRAVQFFDLLGGADGNLNQQRVADEVEGHRWATGSVPLDVRAIALAITRNCLTRNAGTNSVDGVGGSLAVDQGFFSSRTGMTINDLFNDTRTREQSLPRRKADIEKQNLDRTSDIYLFTPGNGLVQEYGAATSFGPSAAFSRLRQEIFRRPTSGFTPDATVMGGVYVDRELYSQNTELLALYRYFLEPLGVSVDKWSMGVRGRSRTYTFADIFSGYLSQLGTVLETSLASDPIPGLTAPFTCSTLIAGVNSTLASLPAYGAVPKYTDVQRIFNKSCIECHGGLGYPPFADFFPANYLDFSENDAPAAGEARLQRSYDFAVSYTTTNPVTSYLYQRITNGSEDCPGGMMPCGGPPLSKTDIETIRRWIVGTQPFTWGDPHLQTVDGTNYDFQSAGEFVLLRGEGIEIQTRQTPVSTEHPLAANAYTGISSCASLNTAVAFRVGGHRITYQPNISGKPDPNGMQLRIDGKLVRLVEKNSIVLPDGGRILPTSAPGGIQIEFSGGTDVIVTPDFWDYYQVWYLNVDVHTARASDGLMGAIVPGSWLPALPDGSLFAARPVNMHDRYQQIFGKFADAWRVTDKTSLFDYAAGTSTASFTFPDWPGEKPQGCQAPPNSGTIRREPLKSIDKELASKYCNVVKDKRRRTFCMQDVMVTGDPTFAETYRAAEQIAINIRPEPPTLLGPENDESGLDSTVRFDWTASADKDQDKLTYMHCVWPAGELPTFNHCQSVPDQGGTMSYVVSNLKLGTPYFWKVVVNDGKGGTTDSETRRFATK